MCLFVSVFNNSLSTNVLLMGGYIFVKLQSRKIKIFELKPLCQDITSHQITTNEPCSLTIKYHLF